VGSPLVVWYAAKMFTIPSVLSDQPFSPPTVKAAWAGPAITTAMATSNAPILIFFIILTSIILI
jgi:hypothetical protein